MDYDVEMLKIYFKEKNFNPEDIEKLLNDNPFNKEYMIWLKQRNNSGKCLAIQLKKNFMINKNINIQEIVPHNMDNIGKYFINNVNNSICHINQDINKVKIIPNNLILVRGKFPNQGIFLQKLVERKNPFIICECTKDYNYYIYLKEYINNNCELCEDFNLNHKICILKSK
jgi:hypothetical protein